MPPWKHFIPTTVLFPHILILLTPSCLFPHYWKVHPANNFTLTSQKSSFITETLCVLAFSKDEDTANELTFISLFLGQCRKQSNHFSSKSIYYIFLISFNILLHTFEISMLFTYCRRKKHGRIEHCPQHQSKCICGESRLSWSFFFHQLHMQQHCLLARLLVVFFSSYQSLLTFRHRNLSG